MIEEGKASLMAQTTEIDTTEIAENEIIETVLEGKYSAPLEEAQLNEYFDRFRCAVLNIFPQVLFQFLNYYKTV